MKRIVVLLLAAVVLVGTGCAGKEKKDNNQISEGTEQLESANKLALPMVVDFSATWCGPCRKFAPLFHKVEKEYEGRLKFLTVDIDEHSDLAYRYNVEAVPTIILLNREGQEVKRLVGAPDEATFRADLERLLQ